MIVTWIARLIAGLNANRRPGEIAAGIATGVLLALMPAGNLLWVAILLLTVFTAINLGIQLLVVALLSGPAALLDPLLHRLGLAVLTNDALSGLFNAVYQVPLVPFTRFKNTVVMGGLVAGVILWVPMFFLGRVLVRVYRGVIHPRIAESRAVKDFQRIPLVSRITALVRRFQGVYSAFT